MKLKFFVLAFLSGWAHSGQPVWSFNLLGSPTITVPSNATHAVHYQIINNSARPHTLSLQNISAVSQNTEGENCGNPVTLDAYESCTLELVINGPQLPQGSVTMSPVLCETRGGNLQCYQPKPQEQLIVTKGQPAGALLVITSNLNLSKKGYTEYGVSGTPTPESGQSRIITVENHGTIVATNVSVEVNSKTPLPQDTTIETNSCNGTLGGGGSCTITIKPGSTSSPGADGTPCTNGSKPIPSVIEVSASNANTVKNQVRVLGYGCQHQGGYIFAFDDTPDSHSNVAGKVVTTKDLSLNFPNGVIWSSNGQSGDSVSVALDSIYGISEISTTSLANPNAGSIPGQVACDGATNGYCNTSNIYLFYSSINPFYYAVGLCKQIISNYSDWYLPAICEMGFEINSGAPQCATGNGPTMQNIQSSLVLISHLKSPAAPLGHYWSSTESSSYPQFESWEELYINMQSVQGLAGKGDQLNVRCIRTMTS